MVLNVELAVVICCPDPLRFNVNEKHKSLICGDMYMYVDFAALLPSHKDDEDKIGEVLFENNNVTISNRKNKKDMFSIWQWFEALLCMVLNVELAVVICCPDITVLWF
jgi:hypothetical protein